MFDPNKDTITINFPKMDKCYYKGKYKVIMPFNSGSYIYNKKTGITNIHEGILVTNDNKVVVIAHGNFLGGIEHYDEIMEIIKDPIYQKYEIIIHTCYPGYVADAHPELSKYIANSDFYDKVSGAIPVYWDESNYLLEEFMLCRG